MRRFFKRVSRSERLRTALCWTAAQYIRLVHATGDWKVLNEEIPDRLHDTGQAFVLAFWHGRLLMMAYAWRHWRKVKILTSGHRDGQLVGRTMAHFGVDSIVGSSSRGGAAAMVNLVRELRRGFCVGITPDGPRGPRMRASLGVLLVARLAKVPVLPLTFSSSHRWVAGSWDSFTLPLPFGRGVFIWGEPITVPENADDAVLEAKRLELERAITALTDRADALMGQPPIEPAPVHPANATAQR